MTYFAIFLFNVFSIDNWGTLWSVNTAYFRTGCLALFGFVIETTHFLPKVSASKRCTYCLPNANITLVVGKRTAIRRRVDEMRNHIQCRRAFSVHGTFYSIIIIIIIIKLLLSYSRAITKVLGYFTQKEKFWVFPWNSSKRVFHPSCQ